MEIQEVATLVLNRDRGTSTLSHVNKYVPLANNGWLQKWTFQNCKLAPFPSPPPLK